MEQAVEHLLEVRHKLHLIEQNIVQILIRYPLLDVMI